MCILSFVKFDGEMCCNYVLVRISYKKLRKWLCYYELSKFQWLKVPLYSRPIFDYLELPKKHLWVKDVLQMHLFVFWCVFLFTVRYIAIAFWCLQVIKNWEKEKIAPKWDPIHPWVKDVFTCFWNITCVTMNFKSFKVLRCCFSLGQSLILLNYQKTSLIQRCFANVFICILMVFLFILVTWRCS